MNMPNAPQYPQSPNGTHHAIQPPWVHDVSMQFNMINQRMQEIHNRLDSPNNLEKFVNNVKHELHDMNSNMQDILNKTHNMDKRIHAIESTQAKTQNDIRPVFHVRDFFGAESHDHQRAIHCHFNEHLKLNSNRK